MMTNRRCSQAFGGSTASGRAARDFAAATLVEWGHEACAENASVCVAELAANAILHGRGPFVVELSETAGGVRVDVTDGRPDVLPIVYSSPADADAADAVTATGRGFQLVAAVATRWGVTTHKGAKTVWAEVADADPVRPTTPVIDAPQEPAAGTPSAPVLFFCDVPAAIAVKSGLQVDELVRELQLGFFNETVTEEERSRFYDLLDRSAPARLAGRRAALGAVSAGVDRFDFEVIANDDLVTAIAAFRELVEVIPARVSGTTAVASPDVVAFRSWLEAEAASQMRGNRPAPCPMR